MKIFVSWSRDRSSQAALALKNWLPKVVQQADPWSSQDIESGQRWGSEVDARLSETDFGILCLTRENLEQPWILFEAGALAKRVQDKARVVPYLIDDISPTELDPPLSLLQATKSDKGGTWRLIKSINNSLNSPLSNDVLEGVFDALWPQLDKELQGIPASEIEPEERDEEDILSEVLETVRGMSQQLDSLGSLFRRNARITQDNSGKHSATIKDPQEILSLALEMFEQGKVDALLEEQARVPGKSEAIYVEDSAVLDRETEREITPLDWTSVIQALKERKLALTATVFAEGVSELRGDLLIITFPKESDFYAREGQKPRHLDALKEVVEDVVGVRPHLVLKVKTNESSNPS